MYGQTPTKTTIFNYPVKNIHEENFDWNSVKGKKILLVNTASKCGLTPQYEQLEALYKKYKDKNFVILGFPSNDFMQQEPGSNEEIAQFCKLNYGVSFPMMDKIDVKGPNQHPLYKYLTTKSLNGVEDSEVLWNFQKYLIDENGKVVKYIHPKTSPLDPEIISWIESK